MDARSLFRFGDFTLDVKQRLLYHHEERLRVQPKLLDLLILLVEHRGAVVSHDEIVRRIWPNTVVEACGLTRNISLLRKHLDSAGARYIENIPKRGYRLAVEITEIALDSHDIRGDRAHQPSHESRLSLSSSASATRNLGGRLVPASALAIALMAAILALAGEGATPLSMLEEQMRTIFTLGVAQCER